jgi:hypothetical protein
VRSRHTAGAIGGTHEHDEIVTRDRAAAGDVRVEREAAVEPAADVAQHRGIGIERVGIHGRDRTARAQRVETDDCVAHVQVAARIEHAHPEAARTHRLSRRGARRGPAASA